MAKVANVQHHRPAATLTAASSVQARQWFLGSKGGEAAADGSRGTRLQRWPGVRTTSDARMAARRVRGAGMGKFFGELRPGLKVCPLRDKLAAVAVDMRKRAVNSGHLTIQLS